MSITNKIKQLRLERRLTQEEVGKILGIDSTTVSKHESGARALSDVDIKKYAKLFKVETYELFMEAEGAERVEGDAVNGE
jgi:transcriptional regulator with XRE-family HTH domain